MSETWVLDASPLIVLAKVGRLDLVRDAGRRVVVPTAVVREVMAGPEDDLAAAELRGGMAALVAHEPDAPAVVEWGLGAGETSVLSMALTRKAIAVVDDREARAAAKALGVTFVGTLALVILARRERRLDSAMALLRQLRDGGLRLDDAVVADALERFTDERWET